MKTYSLIFLAFLALACKSRNSEAAEALPVEPVAEPSTRYRETPTRYFDLLHMDLALRPDWDKKYLHGVATLRLKPYFAPMQQLILDAKGMLIGEVNLLSSSDPGRQVRVEYDQYRIQIPLDRVYTSKDTVVVRLVYTARPHELYKNCPTLDPGGRGLFFIQPGKYTPSKPQQIWTQGEPQDASVWFPTQDDPQERLTHTISLTVPENMKTLSNGMLTSSIVSDNGTRTDVWSMDQPHAPYLVMVAAGVFAEIKDQWFPNGPQGKAMPVHYFVEPAYAAHAKAIFPHTPEMLRFFSERLGVTYPWPKYHQIIVRDYTSGAMENTSAVVFGEYFQKYPEELMGQTYETTIAHELFHHWFGDLVTCESWVHLALNEAFANYSEYLWLEHAYGKDRAEAHRFGESRGYFGEANDVDEPKKEALIRYDYFSKEDMFDAHSYNKGGLILHALRQEVGDSAFFLSLKKYLNDRAYQSAEVHHLRFAFEEVTGRDLTLFFNQWFLGKGHPTIRVKSQYLASEGFLQVVFKQTQFQGRHANYRMKVPVQIIMNDLVTTIPFVLRKNDDTLWVKLPSAPKHVVVDPERTLPVQWQQDWNWETMIALFSHPKTGVFLQLELLEKTRELGPNPKAASIVLAGLQSPVEDIRKEALSLLPRTADSKEVLTTLSRMVVDPSPVVRREAMEVAAKLPRKEAATIWAIGEKDAAAMVRVAAVENWGKSSSEALLDMLRRHQADTTPSMVALMSDFQAQLGAPDAAPWFLKNYDRVGDNSDEVSFILNFGQWITRQPKTSWARYLDFFEEILSEDPMYYARFGAYIALYRMSGKLDDTSDAELKQQVMTLFTQYLGRERNQNLRQYLGLPVEPE